MLRVDGKNKNQPVYVKDFLDVLEDNFHQSHQEDSKNDKQLSILCSNAKAIRSEVSLNYQINTIQNKAKQAINNSLKVIEIFKKNHS